MSDSKKFDDNKPMLDLIPVEFTIGVGKSLSFGSKKYGKHNFKNPGLNYSRLLAAAKRHIELEIAGIEKDDDSGLEHWMLASASLAMYSFMRYHRKDMDDRFEYTEEEKEAIVKMMYGDD